VGHFVRDCPQPDPRVMGPPSSNPGPTGAQASGGASNSNEAVLSRRVAPVSTAYLPVHIGKHGYWSLLDTGSEILIIPRSCITDEEVLPNCQKLIAANGTEIDVDGKAIMNLEFDAGFSVRLKFLVSRHVYEVMLGLDWLQN